MEKFYNLLEWLTIDQAIDYVFLLTDTKLAPEDLMHLCNQGQCNVYLSGLADGESILPESGLRCRTTGVGSLHRIRTPHLHTWPPGETRTICVCGTVTQFDLNRHSEAVTTDRFGSRIVYECDWFVEVDSKDYNLRFKNWDIRALADAMNEVDEAPTDEELETVRRQLVLERESKEKAWLSVDEARMDAAANRRALEENQQEFTAIQTKARELELELTQVRNHLEQQAARVEIAETEAEEAKSETEHWWKQYELERECRLLTQAEAKGLEDEVSQLTAEAKPSHLLAIAGLLGLLLDDSRPRYNQGTAAVAIESKGWRGASASGLTKLFAAAKAAAEEADKVAQSKVEARDFAAKKAARN